MKRSEEDRPDRIDACSIVLDTILDHLSILWSSSSHHWLARVPTRQTSSSGKPKSPRIQVVLPEELCTRLAALAEQESRTVSNMARVLIQQGVQRHEQSQLTGQPLSAGQPSSAASYPAAASPAASPVSPPVPGPPSAASSLAGGGLPPASPSTGISNEERLRALENQPPRRLRGAPRRLRLQRPD